MRLRHFIRKVLSTPPRQLLPTLNKGLRRYLKEKHLRRAARRERDGLWDRSLSRALNRDIPSLKALGSSFNPNFFINSLKASEWTVTVCRSFPASRSEILAQAESSLRHEFDLLGSGPTFLGEKIDWHRDFKSGYRWEPGTYFDDYQRVRMDDNSDIKVTRELSRFQHLVPLGKAYWLTGQERYATEFVNQIDDWISSNPALFSVNWDCAMDVGIRAVNWLWGWYFFQNSPSVTPQFTRRFCRSLLSHGRHLMSTLEYYEAPVDGRVRRLNSNHYLSDLAGLVFLGICCPFFKESRNWLEFAKQELFQEMLEQVYPSGVDYEHSVAYQRLVIELFLYPLLLLRMNGHDIPPAVWSRLEKMFEYVLYYTKPDGTHPLCGDADDGRLVVLSQNPIHSHRYLLSLGAVLFDRPDMKKAASSCDESCLWALGPNAVEKFAALPMPTGELQSRGFLDGGFFVLRQDEAYMFVDAADIGIRGRGSHDHNDRLSFELFWKDTTFFSDSGTYVYSADPAARNRFRRTRAHNTIMIDEVEQNSLDEQGNLWTLGNEAAPQVEVWESSPDADWLRVSHRGYERLAKPVTHVRTFRFNKPKLCWTLTDELKGTGEHLAEWFFHFGLGVKVKAAQSDLMNAFAQGLLLEGDNGATLLFRLANPIDQMKGQLIEDWISRSYGVREQSLTLHLTLKHRLPLMIEFHIHA
ncbi:MAG: alginate lyase family protein [Acidobacteriota bacterium]